MLPFRNEAEVWVDAAKLILDPPKGIMLPWWPKFSNLIGGLRPNETTLLCAPTGSGKTQFIAGIAAQLIAQNVPVFAAPVETGDVDFLIRVHENLERVKIKGNYLSKEESFAVTKRIDEKYYTKRKKFPLYLSVHDNRVPLKEMLLTLQFMSESRFVRVALLDNLNFFLDVTSADNQLVEMDNAIHEFVMLAKKIPIHTVLIVHPKKTDKGRVESEFDIKGSSTAVQEASNVILFNRPKPEDIGNHRIANDRELVFKKIRQRGENVNTPVWLSFDNGRYAEIR